MKLAQGQGGQACGSRKMLYRTAPLLGPVWMSEVLQHSSVKTFLTTKPKRAKTGEPRPKGETMARLQGRSELTRRGFGRRVSH